MIDRQLEENLIAPKYFIKDPTLYLDLYIKNENIPTFEKKRIVLEILQVESIQHSKISISLYTSLETDAEEPDKKHLIATALYGFSACYSFNTDCINGRSYQIQFLTHQDKSHLEIFDEYVKKYKNLILFATPALIIFILKRREKRRNAS